MLRIYTKSSVLYNALTMTKSKIALISFAALLADQLTKFIALQFLENPIPVLGDYLVLERSFNPGIAFGIPINPRLTLILSVVIVLFLIRIASTELKFNHLKTQIAFSLILSGALGNILDRLIRGEVVDFINFSFWPSFNLADAFIVIGVITLVIFYKEISKPK